MVFENEHSTNWHFSWHFVCLRKYPHICCCGLQIHMNLWSFTNSKVLKQNSTELKRQKRCFQHHLKAKHPRSNSKDWETNETVTIPGLSKKNVSNFTNNSCETRKLSQVLRLKCSEKGRINKLESSYFSHLDVLKILNKKLGKPFVKNEKKISL